MTTPSDSLASAAQRSLLPGLAVTAITPDADTVRAATMLIVLLAADGANVAAMVPVETGVEEACEPGSHGALVRWAAAHLDTPRQVTPFALPAVRSTMHAADAAGVLLHGAAFDQAHDALCDGRTVLVVADTVGLLDPITPSLTTLDLVSRWDLSVVLVSPVNRWTIGHLRLLASAVQARGNGIAGVVLTASTAGNDIDADAVRDTAGAVLDCPVVMLPSVQFDHDRAELLAAARDCGMSRITARIAGRAKARAK